MKAKKKAMVAVGNREIEEFIAELEDIEVIEKDDDIDIINDILNYEKADLIIVNALLSADKTLHLVQHVYEEGYGSRIIVLSGEQKINVLALAGFGVNAFVPIGEYQLLRQYVARYPDQCDMKLFAAGTQVNSENNVDVGSRPLSSAAEPVHIIGLFGSGYGTGTTTLSVELAVHYSRKGKKAAVVERNHSGHLRRAALKEVDVYDIPLADIPLRSYHYVILDFGIRAEIDPGGEFIARRIEAEEEMRRQLEMQYCQHIILVSAGRPWRLYEAEFYITDPVLRTETKDWIFYFQDAQKYQREMKRWKDRYGKGHVVLNEFDQLVEEIERM